MRAKAILAGAGFVWLGALAGSRPQAAAPQAAPSSGAAELQAIVSKYCVTCHNDRAKTGGLSLQHVDFADVPAHAEVLEKVSRKLLVGAMPPHGIPQPDPPALERLRLGIESTLDQSAASKPNPGRALLRRLNRTEYANAIRDLLDVEIDVSSVLPPDDSSYGFDNIADVLNLSPVLMERYLTAARQVSAVAVGDPAEIRTLELTYRARPDLSQDQHIDGLPLGTRGGILIRHTFPLDAEYTLQTHLLQTTVNNVIGIEYPHTLVLTVDGTEVHRATFGGKDDLTKSFENAEAFADALSERLMFRGPITAGPHEIGVAFLEKSQAARSGLLQPFQLTTSDPVDYTGVPHVRTLTLAGPFDPTGPGDTPSRRRIFQCRPASAQGFGAAKRRADEDTCASRILSTIAARAYRRPLSADDTRTLMTFFEQGRTKPEGTFDSGIEMGVRRILASPNFVLRVERDPAGSPPGGVHSITNLELASRLSFFLWSTGPDEALVQLASQGRLSQPGIIEQQVKRMLADPKSQALIDNFMGQWLYLRNLKTFTPDPREFPDFNDNLRSAMLDEMNLFLESIIREDRSVMDLLTADYTFLNERLARHYDIHGIYGDHMRRVTITQDERRGLFGKGAILAVTSYATRTSPVIRGKWILENVFGTPPPPPPPDVPALIENTAGEKPKTLRARMEAHRANPTCAVCHRVMDPIGFSLENYDAIGRWRSSDAGSPIDAAGQLMDGSPVDGPVTLRAAVVKNPEIFLRTMTEKMMIYALGRGLGAHDMPALRTVTREAAKANSRFSSLVLGIVKSVPFQMRVTPALEDSQRAVTGIGDR